MFFKNYFFWIEVIVNLATTYLLYKRIDAAPPYNNSNISAFSCNFRYFILDWIFIKTNVIYTS